MSERLIAPRSLLGIEEWNSFDLPEHEWWELVDGGITVSPRPTARHNRAAFRLCSLLDAAAPGWVAVQEAEIVLQAEAPATVRAPDVLLVDPAAYQADRQNFAPSEVGLVVEVVSPGSRRTDYVAKRYDYELAGIRYYWIVDPQQQRVTCLKLTGSAYEELAIQPGPTQTFTEPVTISFTWAGLS